MRRASRAIAGRRRWCRFGDKTDDGGDGGDDGGGDGYDDAGSKSPSAPAARVRYYRVRLYLRTRSPDRRAPQPVPPALRCVYRVVGKSMKALSRKPIAIRTTDSRIITGWPRSTPNSASAICVCVFVCQTPNSSSGQRRQSASTHLNPTLR